MTQAASAHNEIENRLYSITERLNALFPKKIDLSLGRIERFLEQLGNPHLNIPPPIHVAGTNGKGSTIALLRSCLEESGQSCHVHTSPHLVRFTERVIIAGEEISEADFLDVLEECHTLNDGAPLSYFEMAMAVIFLIFSRHPADVSLIETGLGGTYDATNVLQNPLATIITSISYDHMDFLGDTLTKIAGEKAGIIKPERPCILGKQSEHARKEGVVETIEARAKDVKAPLYKYGDDWLITKLRTTFLLHFDGKNI